MDTCSTLPIGQNRITPVRLDDEVAHLLRRAHQRASAIYLAILADQQLTPTQYFAMARLHEVGEISQNRLGRLAAMDPATIQGVIQRLAERGYVHRLPDTTDRRRMVLSLSRQGRTVVEALLEETARANEAILEPLAPEQRESFVALLRQLS